MATETFRFDRCGINVIGTASCTSQGGRRVVVPIGPGVVASVHAKASDAGVSWGTAVLKVRIGNFLEGPYNDFPSPVTIAGEGVTERMPVSGYHYLAVDVTTVEGADEYVDIAISLSDRSN